jgi:hypothetical protein
MRLQAPRGKTRDLSFYSWRSPVMVDFGHRRVRHDAFGPAYLGDRKTLGKDDTERVIISRFESRLRASVVRFRSAEQPSEAPRNIWVLRVRWDSDRVNRCEFEFVR